MLAGSQWPRPKATGAILIGLGRPLVACTLVFYGIEHFFQLRHVPGVPLEKLTPAWIPAPVLLSAFVGITLLAAGIGLLLPRARQIAAAGAGTVLLLLTALFYIPILATELRTPLAMEGLNYVGDTLLFASTVLLAGLNRTDEIERS